MKALMPLTHSQNIGSSIDFLMSRPRVLSTALTLLSRLPGNSGYVTASLRLASFCTTLCIILFTLPQRVTTGKERPMVPCSHSHSTIHTDHLNIYLQHHSHCPHTLTAVPYTMSDAH